jgi:hypothetical protein
MAFLTPETIAAAARAKRAADAYLDERYGGATRPAGPVARPAVGTAEPAATPLPGEEAARAWARELARRGG